MSHKWRSQRLERPGPDTPGHRVLRLSTCYSTALSRGWFISQGRASPHTNSITTRAADVSFSAARIPPQHRQPAEAPSTHSQHKPLKPQARGAESVPSAHPLAWCTQARKQRHRLTRHSRVLPVCRSRAATHTLIPAPPRRLQQRLQEHRGEAATTVTRTRNQRLRCCHTHNTPRAC